MNVTVLAGGFSTEREVSLTSGSLIANALIENGHRVLLLDLAKGIRELPEDPTDLFRSVPNHHHEIGAAVPNLSELRQDLGLEKAEIGPNVLELCRLSDAVFLALHGGAGENGQIQALLDCYGVPYTGSDYAGSLLAMDKDLSKRLFRDAEIPTPAWTVYDPTEHGIGNLQASIGLPCVIKPIDGGSSVGVSFAETAEDLKNALAEAERYSRRILVERKIKGRELTVGVLGVRVLPPVEIRPKEGFYDYRNKYAGTTEELCPAPIPDRIITQLSDYARRAFRALHLRGYARFDFLLDEEEHLWCIEANTLPGMTPTSLFPLAASRVGITYNALCEILLRMGIDGI